MRYPIPPRTIVPKKHIFALSQKVFQSGLEIVLRSLTIELKKLGGLIR